MKPLVLFIIGIALLFISTTTFYVAEGESVTVVQPKNDTLTISFLFVGDIMQHEPQIQSAWDKSQKKYSYDHCFQYVSDVYDIADITIANLEFTFGGKPYTGYPMFSAPDAVGSAIQNAGIDVLVTANNHTCDRGKKGIIRTIEVIDSLGIPRTGSFKDSEDKAQHHPLIIEKNGFRIALLNYTYGTNGVPIPAPTIVNLIDTAQIAKDIRIAKLRNPDEIIVLYHWGNEYERIPNKEQKMLAEFCYNRGARIVIGSHPHVVQPMQRFRLDANPDVEVAVAYSLGNAISNQRQPNCDGGAMTYISLKKYDDIVEIDQFGYILTWVWIPIIQGERKYYIIPVSKYEQIPGFFDAASQVKVNQFARETRQHLKKHNVNVPEMVWDSALEIWRMSEEE